MEFEFDGVVFHWRGPSPFHFVAVPADDGEVIHDHAGLVTYGWGMIPATVTIGATEWTTALFRRTAAISCRSGTLFDAPRGSIRGTSPRYV